MDSDEDESLDERSTACSDSALNRRFQSWLTNFGTRCRRPQANGPLPELQLYRDSALGTSANRGQGSGSQENNQMFPADQNEMQSGIEVPLLPDVQVNKYTVVQHTGEDCVLSNLRDILMKECMLSNLRDILMKQPKLRDIVSRSLLSMAVAQ